MIASGLEHVRDISMAKNLHNPADFPKTNTAIEFIIHQWEQSLPHCCPLLISSFIYGAQVLISLFSIWGIAPHTHPCTGNVQRLQEHTRVRLKVIPWQMNSMPTNLPKHIEFISVHRARQGLPLRQMRSNLTFLTLHGRSWGELPLTELGKQ